MKAVLGCGAALLALVGSLALLAVVLAGDQNALTCQSQPTSPSPAPGGGWVATAYGPPWGANQGDGITATGLDLTAGPPAFEVAVDPAVISLGSYVHIQPNPFATDSAFLAGDTGGAIIGRHVDIYDWKGRAAQDAWGKRTVTVSAAAQPGAGNLLGGVAPVPAVGEAQGQAQGEGEAGAVCEAPLRDGSIGLTAGQTARILPDGSAAAPAEAPAAVKRAIQAGNLIHTLPYPQPDVHYGTLARLWPAYDCSGATSFVLYAAGLIDSNALDSGELEDYGEPGPGRWITIYANSAHAWIVVAGIALDTADYGGPPLPAGSGPRWRGEPLANLQDGTSYVARHPPGL